MSKQSSDSEATQDCIRRLGFGEREAHLEHLLRLDSISRRFRFSGLVGDATIQAHCLALSQRRCVIIGAFVLGCLRGVAEIVPITTGNRLAFELAFSVEREFQGLGLGSVLLAAALEDVAPHDALMVCERDNAGMLQLAARFGATRSIEGNQIFLTLRSCSDARTAPEGEGDIEQSVLLRGYV